MSKTKQRKAKGSFKPKHSLTTNRTNRPTTRKRSAATVRRIKMYNNKPVRNTKGKILKHDFQSQELPNTRIRSDRCWFESSRVISQKDLEFFRKELQSRMSSNYNVILN